jgi:RimJ/RimL family protein N-acetyltransferase
MELTLSQAILRPCRESDIESLVKHIGSAAVARDTSAIPHPYTAEHAREWLQSEERSGENQFAITVDAQVVGGIGLMPLDRLPVSAHAMEIGYWLGEAYWGRGMMTEAVRAVTEWGLAELKLVRIEASVYARNAASARVLEKAGFVYEGRRRARYFKEGEYIDGLMYARVRAGDLIG